MQHIPDGHGGAGHAVLCQYAAEIGNTRFIGALAQADIKVLADHHHIAALDGALGDVFDAILGIEPAQRLDDVRLFAVARRRAGVGDDRALRRDHGYVLHKAAVRIFLHRRQHGHFRAAGAHGFYISVVLAQRQFIVRLAQIRRRNAVNHRSGRSANNHIAKHNCISFQIMH